jgi:hypothetical protein
MQLLRQKLKEQSDAKDQNNQENRGRDIKLSSSIFLYA